MYNWPAKPIKPFPVHEKVDPIFDNWITPEKWPVPVVDPLVSVLNKHLTVQTEDVPLFRDPAEDNQGNPEFQDLAIMKQLPPAMLFCVNTRLENVKFPEWL